MFVNLSMCMYFTAFITFLKCKFIAFILDYIILNLPDTHLKTLESAIGKTCVFCCLFLIPVLEKTAIGETLS